MSHRTDVSRHQDPEPAQLPSASRIRFTHKGARIPPSPRVPPPSPSPPVESCGHQGLRFLGNINGSALGHPQRLVQLRRLRWFRWLRHSLSPLFHGPFAISKDPYRRETVGSGSETMPFPVLRNAQVQTHRYGHFEPGLAPLSTAVDRASQKHHGQQHR